MINIQKFVKDWFDPTNGYITNPTYSFVPLFDMEPFWDIIKPVSPDFPLRRYGLWNGFEI